MDRVLDMQFVELQLVSVEAAAELVVDRTPGPSPFQARGEEEAALASKVDVAWVRHGERGVPGVLRVDDQVQRDDDIGLAS